jgi:hypothetical protein
MKVTKITVAEEMLKGKAPMALEKLLKKKDDINKLYKGDMCSLLLVFYGQDMDKDKTKKPELVNILHEKIQGKNHYALQYSDLDFSELFPPTAEPTSLAQ